jgi:arginase
MTTGRAAVLIGAPTDIGASDRGASMGPEALRVAGLAEALRNRGLDVVDRGNLTGPANPWQPATEGYRHLAQVTDWNRLIYEAIRAELGGRRLPILLGGDHCLAIGSISAIARHCRDTKKKLRVLWLDAHADFNTPETTTSGFLDGMALAALTGQCWRALTASIPGFRPVSDAHVVLVGARDIDPAEEQSLASSRVMRVEAARLQAAGTAAALDAALIELARHVSRVYLHIDLDVHEPADAQANQYAVPGGLFAGTVRDLVGVVADRFTIAAAALTAFDPSYDSRMLETGLLLAEAIAKRTE